MGPNGGMVDAYPAAELPESEDMARLVAGAQSGDRLCFDRLFWHTTRWRRQLVRFYLSWLPDEPDTLEELTALMLFQAVLTYDDSRGSFTAWYRFLLRRAVYRAHLEWRRRRATLVYFSELEAESIEAEDRHEDLVPDIVYHDDGIRKRVRLSHLADRLHAMARTVLDRQLLQVYELCFRLGLSQQETARRLGISRHAVARQVAQVRKALIPLLRQGI